MAPSKEILIIAPKIIRSYGLSFLLMPLNIFSTYYFQAIIKPRVSFLIAILRGLIFSGILITTLPLILGGSTIYLAMPLTEFIVAIYVILMLKYSSKEFI